MNGVVRLGVSCLFGVSAWWAKVVRGLQGKI